MDRTTRSALRSAVVLIRDISAAISEAVAVSIDPALVPNAMVAVLSTLATDGPRRPRQLLAPTGLSPSGLSGALGRLEELGLVRRAAGAVGSDRRGVEVRLTPQGRRAVDHLSLVIGEATRAVAPSVKELATLAQHLDPSADVAAGNVSDVELLAVLGKLGTAIGELLPVRLEDGSVVDGAAVAVLCLLDEHGGTRPGYIGERFRLTSGGVTRVLSRLEVAGLCRRRYGEDAADRRAVTAEITTEGRRVVDVAIARLGESPATVLEIVSSFSAIARS